MIAPLPISTPGERLGTLTVLSLNPSNPLTEERLEAALSLAGQAALAIDRARLYEQQKDFADMMQRSLLPQDQPELEGLEVGHVYASSARVDVGGLAGWRCARSQAANCAGGCATTCSSIQACPVPQNSTQLPK